MINLVQAVRDRVSLLLNLFHAVKLNLIPFRIDELTAETILAHHELTKTLTYMLRGSQYPINVESSPVTV